MTLRVLLSSATDETANADYCTLASSSNAAAYRERWVRHRRTAHEREDNFLSFVAPPVVQASPSVWL